MIAFWVLVTCVIRYHTRASGSRALEQAIAEEVNGNFESAIYKFRLAITESPLDVRCLYHLGRFALRRSQHYGGGERAKKKEWGSMAIESLRNALELAPRHATISRMLGVAFLLHSEASSPDQHTALRFFGFRFDEGGHDKEPIPMSSEPTMLIISALALLRVISPETSRMHPKSACGYRFPSDGPDWPAGTSTALFLDAFRNSTAYEVPLALAYLKMWEGYCSEAAHFARVALHRTTDPTAFHLGCNVLEVVGLETEADELRRGAVNLGVWEHHLQPVAQLHRVARANLHCGSHEEYPMLATLTSQVESKLSVMKREAMKVVFSADGSYNLPISRARTFEAFRCSNGAPCNRIRPGWPPFPFWQSPTHWSLGSWSETYLWSQEPGKYGVGMSSDCDTDHWPETCKILEDIVNLRKPDSVTAEANDRFFVRRVAISLVEPPFTKIPVHANTPTQGRWRFHCPLYVPPDSTSALFIGDEKIEFVEGRCFCFDESFLHTLEYQDGGSGMPRISLYFDLVHPGDLDQPEIEPNQLPFQSDWFFRALRPGGELDRTYDDG